eukprot:867237-Pelagomonas_calceolata.AAC.1
MACPLSERCVRRVFACSPGARLATPCTGHQYRMKGGVPVIILGQASNVHMDEASLLSMQGCSELTSSEGGLAVAA